MTKVHHCMVDGIAGTDLLTTMFGPDAGEAADGGALVDEDPEPPSRRSGLVLDALDADVRGSARAARTFAAALVHPRTSLRTARTTGQGLLHFLSAVRPVARTTLVGPLGSDRLYRWAEVPLADALAVREAFGCTVNDVVLAAVATGYQDLLIGRGEQPSARAVRTLVPVSVRRPDQQGVLDNRVSAILVDLPADRLDPVEMLAVVADRMRRLKRSHEAEAGELVTELGNVVPPPGLALGLHVAFRLPHRILSTVTTNVPGPPGQLRLAGRPMVAAYPYVPIADRVRTGIAVRSYGGALLFGITADRDSTPDVDRLRDGLVRGFEELTHRAREQRETR